MSHKKTFEALDRTLQDLLNNNKPMGGVTMVMSGDFRQRPPVIPQGTRADAVHTSIKKSYLWTHIRRLYWGHYTCRVCTQLLQLGRGFISKDCNGQICLHFRHEC